MDPRRFDTLAKSLAAPTTRRATLGTLAAGGLLGALGLRRPSTDVRGAAPGGTCVLAFVATVRLGPSVGRVLTPGGSQPGELRGELSFSLSETGRLEAGSLLLPDGTGLPVVGQATGHALQLRIELGQGRALVGVGVGEQEVAACRGALDGPATGPEVGDLGDWHAGAVQPTGGTGTGGSATRTTTRPAKESVECASGLGRCGGACVDLGTDPAHCGACGTACAAGQGCVNGVCAGGARLCTGGLTNCGGACVDLGADPAHCGACGTACAADEGCVNGVCTAGTPLCPTGQTDCGGTCVDLRTDADHCGRCGAFCTMAEACCGGCVDLLTDPAHCRACGTACAAGQSCVNGVCTGGAPLCPTGQTDCGGTCIDLMTDRENCGLCMASCTMAQICCGGGCFSHLTDNANCGACGKTCAAGEACLNGICQQPPPPVCAQTGQSCAAADCCLGYCNQDNVCECAADGGPCIPVGTGGCCSGQPCNADGFCGACGTPGTPCNSNAECCSGGQYAALCCFDGTRLTSVCTDVTNIGFVCPGEAPGPVACPAGQTDCGGACVDLLSNAGNCGACGVSCPLGGYCAGGACQGGGGGCLALGSPCTYGVDVCCGGACLNGVCQCSPARDVCADGSTCCSGICGADGFCA